MSSNRLRRDNLAQKKFKFGGNDIRKSSRQKRNPWSGDLNREDQCHVKLDMTAARKKMSEERDNSSVEETFEPQPVNNQQTQIAGIQLEQQEMDSSAKLASLPESKPASPTHDSSKNCSVEPSGLLKYTVLNQFAKSHTDVVVRIEKNKRSIRIDQINFEPPTP